MDYITQNALEGMKNSLDSQKIYTLMCIQLSHKNPSEAYVYKLITDPITKEIQKKKKEIKDKKLLQDKPVNVYAVIGFLTSIQCETLLLTSDEWKNIKEKLIFPKPEDIKQCDDII